MGQVAKWLPFWANKRNSDKDRQAEALARYAKV